MTDGVSSDDFGYILADMGRTVSYEVVTKTTDAITGQEISTFATAVNKTVVFFLEQEKWMWDKEGLVELGDAYIMATVATGIKRYDKFTIDGNTYYIEAVYKRHVLTTAMCDFGVAFKVN